MFYSRWDTSGVHNLDEVGKGQHGRSPLRWESPGSDNLVERRSCRGGLPGCLSAPSAPGACAPPWPSGSWPPCLPAAIQQTSYFPRAYLRVWCNNPVSSEAVLVGSCGIMRLSVSGGRFREYASVCPGTLLGASLRLHGNCFIPSTTQVEG